MWHNRSWITSTEKSNKDHWSLQIVLAQKHLVLSFVMCAEVIYWITPSHVWATSVCLSLKLMYPLTLPACCGCRSVSTEISKSCVSPGKDLAAWQPQRPPASLDGRKRHAPWSSSRSTGHRNTHSPLGGARRAEERRGEEGKWDKISYEWSWVTMRN